MKNSVLIVVLGKAARPTDLAALSDSARENNLHLNVLILATMPQIPVSSYGTGFYGSLAIPEHWQTNIDSMNSALEKLRAEVSSYLAQQGASAEVRVASGENPFLADTIANLAQTSDTVIIGDDLRDDKALFNAVLRAALFHAPAGVILNAMTSTRALQPKSAFVAWKAGVPSSRAVRAALPILRQAKDVFVALFDPQTNAFNKDENPGSDVAAWLSHQGCQVTLQQYPSGGEEIGTVMQKRANEVGADLIVMGAYDHSRMRETIFGGTTRTLIEQRDMPILLCH